MRIKSMFREYTRVFFISTVMLLTLLILTQDILLFKSDVLSFLTFLSGILFFSIPLNIVITGIILLFGKILHKIQSIDKCLHHISLAVMIASFFIIGIDFIIYKISWVPKQFEKLTGFSFTYGLSQWENIICLYLLIILISGIISVSLKTQSHSVAKRLTKLALGTAIIGMFLFPTLKFINYMGYRRAIGEQRSNAAGKKGIILFVVDALGAQYLSSFNPNTTVKTPNIEEFAKKSTIYTQCYTNYPYTHGAFDVLYSGLSKKHGRNKENLMTILQNEAVNLKFIVSHRDPLPDTRKLPYRGLRAYWLTQYYTFLPKILGIDYHVAQYGIHKGESRRLNNLLSFLNNFFHQSVISRKNVFETLLDELEQLQADKRNILIIVHFFVIDWMVKRNEILLDVPYNKEDTQNKTLVEEQLQKLRYEIYARVQSNDYCYSKEEQWWVDEEKNKYLQSLQNLDKHFGKFLIEFRKNGWDKEFDIIFMADHGNTFDDGKIWYAYHVDQTVTRIPLMLYRHDAVGKIDSRLCQTADIPCTITDFFGIQKHPFQGGYSLVRDQFTENVPCFGLIRSKDKIALTVIYEDHKKHVFEIDHGLREIRYDVSYSLNDFGMEEKQFSANPVDREILKEQIRSYITF